MVGILKIWGWFGIISAVLNMGIKLFGSDDLLNAMRQSNRSLNLNLAVIAFCMIFLALASILVELRSIRIQVDDSESSDN